MENFISINTEQQYNWALSRIDQLLPKVSDETPSTDPSAIELYMLAEGVEAYEEVHYPISEPSLKDTLRLRMYEMGLTQAALARLIGVSPSRVCDYLSGRAEPTLKIARVISQKLDIDPAIVLGV